MGGLLLPLSSLLFYSSYFVLMRTTTYKIDVNGKNETANKKEKKASIANSRTTIALIFLIFLIFKMSTTKQTPELID